MAVTNGTGQGGRSFQDRELAADEEAVSSLQEASRTEALGHRVAAAQRAWAAWTNSTRVLHGCPL